jgi:argininosuccinate lyase
MTPMTSQAKQSELYARLQEVLGPQPGETLMTLLSTTDQYATKADIASVRTELIELKQNVRELRSKLSQFVRTFIAVPAAAMVGLTGIFIGVTKLL